MALWGYKLIPVLEFFNNLWVLEPSRNRVVVPAPQATHPGGIGSLESILGLIKSLKIRAEEPYRPFLKGAFQFQLSSSESTYTLCLHSYFIPRPGGQLKTISSHICKVIKYITHAVSLYF
jgi:hypothetical protein